MHLSEFVFCLALMSHLHVETRAPQEPPPLIVEREATWLSDELDVDLYCNQWRVSRCALTHVRDLQRPGVPDAGCVISTQFNWRVEDVPLRSSFIHWEDQLLLLPWVSTFQAEDLASTSLSKGRKRHFFNLDICPLYLCPASRTLPPPNNTPNHGFCSTNCRALEDEN